MKIYGRGENNNAQLKILSETTFVADPDALRDLAAFLYRCADAIEDQGEEWENDYFDSNDISCPQIIVFNPNVVEE